MRRRVAMLIALLLICSTVISCAPIPRKPRDQNQATVEAAPPMETTRQPTESTPAPSVSPQPTGTPMPTINAQWYVERNKQLSELIKRYHPAEPEEDVARDIARMAIDPDKPMVALTFDDGPIPGITDQILDILEENNARATFFVLGWRLGDEKKQDILRRAVSLGCEIGNHTWSHRKMLGQNYVGLRYEVLNTNNEVFDITGTYPHCLRPPGGQYTYEAMRIARENDMIIALWAQSGNVMETDPNKIAQNVEKQIVNGKELEDGDIILLHDTHTCMVDAVKIIVPKLIEEGYQLVTVWELLNCAEQPPVPGELYKRQQQ